MVLLADYFSIYPPTVPVLYFDSPPSRDKRVPSLEALSYFISHRLNRSVLVTMTTAMIDIVFVATVIAMNDCPA